MQDMTTSEMLKDPLIRQMLRADKVSVASFAALLDAARNRHATRDGSAFAPPKAHDTWNVDAAAFI